MTEEQAELALEMLRGIRNELADLKKDALEVKARVGHLEGLYGSLSVRVDRITGSLAELISRT